MCHKNWWNNNRWCLIFSFSHANVQFKYYISNYPETTGNLWFSSKDETTNFNANIANNSNFRSFKYKNKLLGDTVADGDNGILENATIVAL